MRRRRRGEGSTRTHRGVGEPRDVRAPGGLHVVALDYEDDDDLFAVAALAGPERPSGPERPTGSTQPSGPERPTGPTQPTGSDRAPGIPERGTPERGEPGVPAAPPRRRHPAAWWFAALLVALLGSAGIAAMGERLGAVDVADLAGGLRPLDRPARVGWSVALPLGDDVVVAPGAVVTVSRVLTAHAVDDGRVLWTSGPLPAASACLPGPGDPTGDVIVCRSGEPGTPETASVTTVDARSGEVLGRRTVRVAGRAVDVVGAKDLVRVYREGAGAVVVREDAATGQVRWERHLDRHEPDHGNMNGFDGDDIDLWIAGGVLSVLGDGFSATFAEDGTVLEAGDVWTIVALPDGRYAGNEYGGGTATVFTSRGEPAFRVAGRILEPALTDRSSPGVLVANTFGGVEGLDAATGAPLWQVEGPGYRAVVRLDGRAVVQSDASYRSVDLRTGEVIWTHRTRDPGLSEPATDGRSLVVTEANGGADPDLLSLSLEDGRVEWRRRLPVDTYHVFATGGQLFALRPHDIVALS